MANKLNDVTITPTTVASGGKVDVVVSYQANSNSVGVILHSPGFKISAEGFEVEASQDGIKTFKLTITRQTSTNVTCQLEFQLFTDRKMKRVTVQ